MQRKKGKGKVPAIADPRISCESDGAKRISLAYGASPGIRRRTPTDVYHAHAAACAAELSNTQPRKYRENQVKGGTNEVI